MGIFQAKPTNWPLVQDTCAPSVLTEHCKAFKELKHTIVVDFKYSNIHEHSFYSAVELNAVSLVLADPIFWGGADYKCPLREGLVKCPCFFLQVIANFGM